MYVRVCIYVCTAFVLQRTEFIQFSMGLNIGNKSLNIGDKSLLPSNCGITVTPAFHLPLYC